MAMARPLHVQIPHHRPRGERPAPAAGFLLIVLLALLAAVWMNHPPVASLLPIHPPG
jgi:hypothetical protein